MSKHRQPGEIVRRRAGSGFVASKDPELIQIPTLPAYNDETSHCMLECGNPDCVEWANLAVIILGKDGDHGHVYHVSECQMEDYHLPKETRITLAKTKQIEYVEPQVRFILEKIGFEGAFVTDLSYFSDFGIMADGYPQLSLDLGIPLDHNNQDDWYIYKVAAKLKNMGKA